RDKFAFFDKECSRVAEHIYLRSDSVARNRETLRESGITHVLNCVGFVCPEYFRDDLSYKTLWLQDSPSEDITSILYDVFDYFEEVREQSGRVFVHCCQGVSRSTSLVIAYLMWRDGRSFEDAFQDVKAARGVTNPNMGFACQLLQCQKRVHATPVSPNSALRMYRMAPHSPYDPLHLVPKTVNHPAASALDSRGAFVVHVPGALYVWQGSKCDSGMAAAAHAFTCQVVRYERADDNNIQVLEGEEPSEFWEALRSEMPLVGKNVGHQDPGAGKDSGSPETGRNAESGTVFLRVKQLAVYDTDYSLYHRAKGQALMPVEPIPGVVIHGTPRDSGWSRLRRKFFCIPGSKPMLMREGVNGAGLSQPDGDEQVVPITRRPASFVQEDVKVETTVIIKSVRLEAEAPELYEWPQMEKIDMFMEDDLESHAAYVLVVPDAPSGRGGHVYVWVGQSWKSDGDGESPEEDDNGHRTSEEHWVIIGQDLIKQWELRLDIPVKVVEEGDEPDEFWEHLSILTRSAT
ncbi:unnamed protein product, partial [Sphagnum jensenii]